MKIILVKCSYRVAYFGIAENHPAFYIGVLRVLFLFCLYDLNDMILWDMYPSRRTWYGVDAIV